jgi:hypothetical protein
VAELLSQMNEILEDMPFIEGNLPTGHRGSVRTSPADADVAPHQPGRRPDQDDRGPGHRYLRHAGPRYAVVDKALADLNGNSAAWRAQENKGFIEGMAQDMAAQLSTATARLTRRS